MCTKKKLQEIWLVKHLNYILGYKHVVKMYKIPFIVYIPSLYLSWMKYQVVNSCKNKLITF